MMARNIVAKCFGGALLLLIALASCAALGTHAAKNVAATNAPAEPTPAEART